MRLTLFAWGLVCAGTTLTACKGNLGGARQPATTIFHGVTTQSWISYTTPAPQQPDAISAEVTSYEAAAGRTVAWVAFANEFSNDGRVFPAAIATSIRNRGATPLIYLSLRSGGLPEPLFTLDAINAGQFDPDFIAWADGAKNFGSQVIVDWGWEMNISDAPWNGVHNGGAVEGPRRYRQAFRHIVELMRGRGANNIHWAFHVNYPESPTESWNAFENYYPGDDLVDSVGASIYGAQSPIDGNPSSFVDLMNVAYPRLAQMAPMKPIMIYEFGTCAGHPTMVPANWAADALTGMFTVRWPRLRGFAWWNEHFQADYSPSAPTEMRLEFIPDLAAAFRSHLIGEPLLGDRPPIGGF